MEKVTKKKQIEELQTVVAAQWRQINKLKLHLGRLVDVDCSDEQDNHDEVIAILDSKKPKLKQLDQSVFDGLDAKWRFAAVDRDGKAHKFNLKAEPHDDVGEFMSTGSNWSFEYELIDHDYDASNWPNSLIERDKVELTGSDLCRAMLGSGFEYVMCLVGDECEESTSNSEVVRVVRSCGADYFDDTTEDMWYFAIPINNQGEPLTASEVGL